MSNAIVSNVYRYVIDDVINQVRGEFEDMGIDEAVLQELQRSWETKVARSRVANFGFNAEGYYGEDAEQSNANNDNEKNSATINSSGDNSSSASKNNNPAMGGYPEAYSQHSSGPTAAANLATIANSGVRSSLRPEIIHNNNSTNNNGNNNNNNNLRPPSQHQLPPASIPYSLPPHLPPVNTNGPYPPMNQRQPSLSDLHLPGGARPNIPQNDGADDNMTTEEIDAHINKIVMEAHEQVNSNSNNQDDDDDDAPTLTFSATTSQGDTLTMEKLPEHIQLLMKDARARAIQAGSITSKSRIGQLDGVEDNDDINSDLDDSDDADDDGDGGEEIEHIILCLYDKVTRTKNKWKCVLKDGIMLVNGRDYLFHRANGEFEW